MRFCKQLVAFCSTDRKKTCHATASILALPYRARSWGLQSLTPAAGPRHPNVRTQLMQLRRERHTAGASAVNLVLMCAGAAKLNTRPGEGSSVSWLALAAVFPDEVRATRGNGPPPSKRDDHEACRPFGLLNEPD